MKALNIQYSRYESQRMKLITEYWGIILIPESEFDVSDMKRLFEKIKLPENVLSRHSEGKAVWHEEQQLELQQGSTTTPMGALMIYR